jgi:CYTH domain-containing protein
MEEIELTFLPKTLPAGLKSGASKEMFDLYLPEGSPRCWLRVTKRGDKMEITKKIPVDGVDSSRMHELNLPLSPEEYATLITLPGKRVEKTRYYYHEKDVDYEIDVFGGDLTGLVMVEVEFASVEEKNAFTSPDWCLCDISHEKLKAGGMLTKEKYADIAADLQAYGYTLLTV